MGSVDEMAVILQRFGDEESTLLDQYERLSFEVQLNQAILRRSLSEPCTVSSRRRAALVTMAPALPPPQSHVSQVPGGGRRKLGFQKVLKKLLKPILGGKGTGIGRAARKDVRDHQKDIKFWKTFSRSFRV